MEFSNYDWKLSSNVQTKIILKRLGIQNETTTQNEAVQTRAKVDGDSAQKSSNRKRMSGRSMSSKRTRETETNPVESDSAFNLNSGDIIQELQKVIVDFDPGCSTCSNVILQLSRHIRDTHSPQAQPSRSRPKTCPSPTPRNTCSNHNYPCDFCVESFLTAADLQRHLGSHTPPTFVKPLSALRDHTTTAAVQQGEIEVAAGGHRRSSRKTKTVNYDDLISGPEPTTRIILESLDSSGNENGHQDCSSLNTGDAIKVEEIDISDNEDPSYILEKDQADDDGDLSGNNDDGISNDNYSEVESEKEKKLAVHKKSETRKKVHNETKVHTGEQIKDKKRYCEICDVTFDETRLLTRHNNRFHSGGDKNGGKYSCKTCGKRFYLRDRLRMHRKIHIQTELTNHKRLHTGEKVNVKKRTCELCNMTFRMTGTLKRHNDKFHSEGDTTHDKTGGQYKCKTCGKRFYFMGRLKIHSRIHTGFKLYKCEVAVCGKSYIRKDLFDNHKILHTGEKIKTYKCTCCDKEFSNKGALNKHISHQNSQRKCKYCKLECLNNEDLNEHMKSTHSEEFVKPYKCNICKSVKFGTGKELRSHFEETHPETLPFVCKVCNKRFMEESYLNKHLPFHKKDDRYKCEYCSRGFPLPNHLEEHLRVHTKEKPHNCEICGKCFAAKEALMKHENSHTGRKSHTCEKCDQTFDARDILLTHTEEIHGGDKLEISTGEKIKKRKNYGCGICSNKFFAYKYLSSHLRRSHGNVRHKEYGCKFCEEKFFAQAQMNEHVEKSHPGQKSFQCKICNKEFTKEYLLVQHSIIHNEEKTLSCTHPGCEKKFKTKIMLKKHLLRHTGIKAYKCDECDKAFGTSGYLAIHKRTHTGEKPFMCEVCSKCFARKTGLDSHAKIHKDDKSHVCKDCGKCFRQRAQLTTHSKIHTGVKEHLCEECGASFRLPHQLRAHLKGQAHAIRK